MDFSIHLIYAIFTFVRYIQYRHTDVVEADEQLKVLIEFFFAVHLVPTFGCHSLFFLREEAVAGFINQYIAYFFSIKNGSE